LGRTLAAAPILTQLPRAAGMGAGLTEAVFAVTPSETIKCALTFHTALLWRAVC